MAHPSHLREKARELRNEGMSLSEIAESLELSKTTVWYWIKDLPDPAIQRRLAPERRAALLRAQAKAAAANRQIASERRRLAYRQGWCEFAVLDGEPGFRDFVCMYIGEGYKRNRNRVAISNSDPRVVRLGDFWIRRFAINFVGYSLQYHADQDPEYLKRFWCGFLAVGDQRFGSSASRTAVSSRVEGGDRSTAS